MKTIHGWLKLILCSAMFVLLASCITTYIPNDSTVRDMSVKDAQKVLGTLKLNSHFRVGYASELATVITAVRVTSKRLYVTDENGKQSIFIFREIPQISHVSGDHILLEDKLIACDVDIANALYVLQQNAIKQENEANKNDANFAASLADYRNRAASNAVLPEEANKFKIQAEGAVRDKAFDDAADLYAEALKISPWWPAGHFNRAQVLGETGDYGEAMREMKHYLQLVPDAPNARAAQNKIYDWERLESK